MHSAGSTSSTVEWLPLQQIDASKRIGITTSLFVPASSDGSFTELRNKLAGRRTELAETWDELTHAQLAPGLSRAAKKVLNAAESESARDLADALACVLVQAVAHMQLAEDDMDFATGDVLKQASGLDPKLE